jgi:hypothetical protein
VRGGQTANRQTYIDRERGEIQRERERERETERDKGRERKRKKANYVTISLQGFSPTEFGECVEQCS